MKSPPLHKSIYTYPSLQAVRERYRASGEADIQVLDLGDAWCLEFGSPGSTTLPARDSLSNILNEVLVLFLEQRLAEARP